MLERKISCHVFSQWAQDQNQCWLDRSRFRFLRYLIGLLYCLLLLRSADVMTRFGLYNTDSFPWINWYNAWRPVTSLYSYLHLHIQGDVLVILQFFLYTKLPLSVRFISRFVLVSPLPCFFYDTCLFFTACHSSPSSVSYHEFGVSSARWAFDLCYRVRLRTGDYCDDDDIGDDDDDLQCF